MAGIQEAMLGSVIDSFYEAAAEPSLWGDVLKQVSFVLGAEGTELFPGPEAKFVPLNSESLDEAVSYVGFWVTRRSGGAC